MCESVRVRPNVVIVGAEAKLLRLADACAPPAVLDMP